MGRIARHRPDAVPWPRRCRRSRRRPGQPCGARPAGRFRQVPLQAHRTGRGHFRPLRQPGACHPPRGVRGCGNPAAVRPERGEAQHRHDQEVRRHGCSARRGRAQPLPRPAEHRWLRPVVLDRHAADRNRSAADWLPPGQARPWRQVPRRFAYDSVDLLLGSGTHQPGRLVRPRYRMREVRRSGDHASGLRGMATVLHVHRQHRDVHRQDGRAHRQDVPRPRRPRGPQQEGARGDGAHPQVGSGHRG